MKKKTIIAAFVALGLASCASTVSPDGTKKTAPDKSTVNSLVGLGRDVIDLFRAPAQVAVPVEVKRGK